MPIAGKLLFFLPQSPSIYMSHTGVGVGGDLENSFNSEAKGSRAMIDLRDHLIQPAH